MFIKCGRENIKLSAGDAIMDNGACPQLLVRDMSGRFRTPAPRVSKKEFTRFKSYRGVSVVKDHGYGDWVTLWEYNP